MGECRVILWIRRKGGTVNAPKQIGLLLEETLNSGTVLHSDGTVSYQLKSGEWRSNRERVAPREFDALPPDEQKALLSHYRRFAKCTL